MVLLTLMVAFIVTTVVLSPLFLGAEMLSPARRKAAKSKLVALVPFVIGAKESVFCFFLLVIQILISLTFVNSLFSFSNHFAISDNLVVLIFTMLILYHTVDSQKPYFF